VKEQGSQCGTVLPPPHRDRLATWRTDFKRAEDTEQGRGGLRLGGRPCLRRSSLAAQEHCLVMGGFDIS